MLTDLQLIEARYWLSDCTWRDVDSEDFLLPADHEDGFTDAEIDAAVARHYDGGIENFQRANADEWLAA